MQKLVQCLLQNGNFMPYYIVLQKQQKHTESWLKALKARNDYLLCVEAANSAINKYFSDDISDLMDVSLSQILIHLGCEFLMGICPLQI